MVGLSTLIGSGWLLTEAYPGAMAFPFAGCVHFGVIGLMGLLVSLRGAWGSLSWGKAAVLAAATLGIFVLPAIVSQLVAGAVSSSASVALFCAVPLLMVLGMAWFGDGAGRGLMMPSLVGLFGALLVFSVEVPRSVRRTVCLMAVFGCCVVAASASIWMFKLVRGIRAAQAVMVTGFAGAAVLGVLGLGVGWPRITLSAIGVEAARCVVFDLPVVWMTVWLMREIPPVRLAARFLIAPLVTWVEGYAMVRGPVEARSIVALLLIAAGAAMLLVQDESDEIRGLRLR